MTNHDVELLAIGAGPANLALAVALEELGADDLATCTGRLTAAAELVELKYDALNEPEYSGRPW